MISARREAGQLPMLYPESLGRPIFAVGCYNARVVIHSVALLPVAGEEARALPAPERSSGKPGEWQDVLAQMDLTQHRRAGHWQKANGAFENMDAVQGGALELPVTAPGASDLRFKLTRLTTASGKVTFAFHIGSHAGQFSIGDYSRPSAGLEYIDGKSITDNGAQVTHKAAYLTIGQPHELLLRLREEGMSAALDGLEIYRWQGEWSRVTQGGAKVPDELKSRNAFAVYVGNGRLRIEEIAFRHVPGSEGKKLPPEPPANVPRTPPLPEAQVFAGNGHRYQYMPGEFTWTEAAANAKSLGGHLATLTSQEEHDWAWHTFSPWVPSQLASAYRTRGWWIGGLRSAEDGQWQWVTGEPFEFSRLIEDSKDTPARVPRLLQHDNGVPHREASSRFLKSSSVSFFNEASRRFCGSFPLRIVGARVLRRFRSR